MPFCCCRFAVPFFRSVATVADAGENGNAGNVFPYTYRDEVTRLVVRLRQNGKNRIRSYCYGTAVTAQRQVATATAQRQRQNGNGMVETRHEAH